MISSSISIDRLIRRTISQQQTHRAPPKQPASSCFYVESTLLQAPAISPALSTRYRIPRTVLLIMIEGVPGRTPRPVGVLSLDLYRSSPSPNCSSRDSKKDRMPTCSHHETLRHELIRFSAEKRSTAPTPPLSVREGNYKIPWRV